MIPIARPLLGTDEAAAAAAVIRSGWLSQGKEVAAFEAEFAARVHAPHACAVSNCTTALHLALLAAGVGPGDEVITASASFIATANVVRECGATPVFVDIRPDDFNIDPEAIGAAASPATRAILCVHQMGMPCDLARILPIAREIGVPVIEDAACAAGSAIRIGEDWQPVGAPHGDAACFSFHPRKVITTGEGGMITTKHAEWDRLFRLWRQHGMDVADSVRHGSSEVVFETYPVRGFNYRMTDIQAAIGRHQLARLPGIVGARRRLAVRYGAMLARLPGIVPPAEPEWARSNWQSYCVRLPEDLDQRAVMQAMLDDGIATRRGIMCAHLEAAHADAPARDDLGESERARRHCILLPLYPGLDENQERVVAALRRALGSEHARMPVSGPEAIGASSTGANTEASGPAAIFL